MYYADEFVILCWLSMIYDKMLKTSLFRCKREGGEKESILSEYVFKQIGKIDQFFFAQNAMALVQLIKYQTIHFWTKHHATWGEAAYNVVTSIATYTNALQQSGWWVGEQTVTVAKVNVSLR